MSPWDLADDQGWTVRQCCCNPSIWWWKKERIWYFLFLGVEAGWGRRKQSRRKYGLSAEVEVDIEMCKSCLTRSTAWFAMHLH